jgi:hypothetical protein
LFFSHCSSRECQKSAWKEHKELCKIIKAATSQATSEINNATTTALKEISLQISEATDETGPFQFAKTAKDEWAARKNYLEDYIASCDSSPDSESPDKVGRLRRIMAMADEEDTAIKKLIAWNRFSNIGKSLRENVANVEIPT